MINSVCGNFETQKIFAMFVWLVITYMQLVGSVYASKWHTNVFLMQSGFLLAIECFTVHCCHPCLQLCRFHVVCVCVLQEQLNSCQLLRPFYTFQWRNVRQYNSIPVWHLCFQVPFIHSFIQVNLLSWWAKAHRLIVLLCEKVD